MGAQISDPRHEAPPVLDRPPDLDVLTASLEKLLREGLSATEETADDVLIGLRGVWARSVDPDDVLSRVKALNGLLRREIPRIPPYNGRDWARGAGILFKLAPGSAKLTLSQRYQRAAEAIPYNADHFRQEIVPRILRQLARQLHEDSQTYVPRGRRVPPGPEISGDTPGISEEQLSTRERALHEEQLSRLWEYVYGLRAELIAFERLKTWPDDEHNDLKLQDARGGALWQLARLLQAIHEYVEQWGTPILHGEAEFNVEALIRLAGWRGEVPGTLANQLRLLRQQYPDRAPFVAQVARLPSG